MKFASYLSSSEPFATKEWKKYTLCLLLFWLAIVVGVSSFHEMWRDEVRALSLALSPGSFLGLPAALKNEGHPLVWYLILRLGFQIVHSTLILKFAAITIAFIAIFQFYRFAPFYSWFKVLFLFTFLPLYEYSVMARNYGISMMFFFSIACFYSQRNERPVLVSVLLITLAHTNIHSAILAFFLTAFWFIDLFYEEKRISWPKTGRLMLFFFTLVILGLVLAVLTVLPDKNSIVLQGPPLKVRELLVALWECVKHPGGPYDIIFHGIPGWGRDLLMWIFGIGLLVRPAAAVILIGGIVCVGTFFSIGYAGVLRHQGLVFIFIITIYWIVLREFSHRQVSGRLLGSIFKSVVYVILPAIFLIHIAGSFQKIHRDLTQDMSSSKAFGKFIKDNSQFGDAIIIGEPDMRLESLPYYVSNRIYVPREGRFQNFVRLTSRNRQELSLGELLETARSLKVKEKKPVIIALGHFDLLNQNPPYSRYESYNKKFSWTEQELHDFNDSTTKLVEFKQDVENERYEVYLLH